VGDRVALDPCFINPIVDEISLPCLSRRARIDGVDGGICPDGRNSQYVVSIMPNAMAKAKSSILFLAPKADVMFDTCRTTVCSLMHSCSATAPLVSPQASKQRTSTCRQVTPVPVAAEVLVSRVFMELMGNR
jgi:hypothetical protein